MSVFICIATTVNGLITANIPHEEWISDVSWQGYLGTLSQTEIAIIGSKTYKSMDDEEFLPNVKFIVLTHNLDHKQRKNVTTSNEEPAALISRLKAEGNSKIGVFGGAEVVTSFLRAGVVDSLILDLEGVLSGQGKNLLASSDDIYRLELMNVEKLDNKTVRLHYKIVYNK